MLETEVIDSGVGISLERQKSLFVPLLELKNRIGVAKPENDNLGLGLSCSKQICRLLGGDMKLKKSIKGMTVLIFKI